MSQCSARTRSERHVSDHVRARVNALARELGIVDPLPGELGELFVHTFARPPRDAEYLSNQLQPGALPLEWSFSEAEPDALRIEIQPFDPTLAGEERLRRIVKAMVPALVTHYGKDLAAQVESAVSSASAANVKLNFGAFVGLVQRPHSEHEFKIYVECDPEDRMLLSSELSNIAGATPHILSVAIGVGTVSERIYYICREGLRALDLEAVCGALGISHRFPALLTTMLELTDGQFHLAPSSVLLGIRQHGRESELKVELVRGTAMSADGLIDRIERLLRPKSVVPFRRWAAMICPGKVSTLPVRVVSVKASTLQPVQLTVYAAEPWSEW